LTGRRRSDAPASPAGSSVVGQRPRGGGRRGATLAEVLVALTVLSIGMAGTMGILTIASRAIQHAEISLHAALAAAEAASRGIGESGELHTPFGPVQWRRVSPALIEVRFDPPEGVGEAREWSLDPSGPIPGELPSWSSWSP